MVLSSLVALGRFAPRRHRVIALGAPFTATMRVVHWIFCDTSRCRAPTQPAHSAGLPPRNIFLIQISYLADSCAAIRQHISQLTRGKLQKRISSFFSHELRPGASTPYQLPALADF